MEKFRIIIEETLRRTVEVEAQDEDKAVAKVEDMYRDCEIVLGAEDFDVYEIYPAEDFDGYEIYSEEEE